MININSIYSKTRTPKFLNLADIHLNICFIDHASFHNSTFIASWHSRTCFAKFVWRWTKNLILIDLVLLTVSSWSDSWNVKWENIDLIREIYWSLLFYKSEGFIVNSYLKQPETVIDGIEQVTLCDQKELFHVPIVQCGVCSWSLPISHGK